MLRKVLVLAIAFGLALSVVACGKKPEPPPAVNPPVERGPGLPPGGAAALPSAEEMKARQEAAQKAAQEAAQKAADEAKAAEAPK